MPIPLMALSDPPPSFSLLPESLTTPRSRSSVVIMSSLPRVKSSRSSSLTIGDAISTNNNNNSSVLCGGLGLSSRKDLRRHSLLPRLDVGCCEFGGGPSLSSTKPNLWFKYHRSAGHYDVRNHHNQHNQQHRHQSVSES
ncbi:hypothetical protein QAD02_016818 [Eretmocerus hayati]|uniref:Uncharacterized protein n=1 Tax=Eretmocerus hayati TaxID=131215 RepID=A0ACC2PDF3_9HYME|nr:hypothetical protein QAD02_016818 [Eretmocerus hayati]